MACCVLDTHLKEVEALKSLLAMKDNQIKSLEQQVRYANP